MKQLALFPRFKLRRKSHQNIIFGRKRLYGTYARVNQLSILKVQEHFSKTMFGGQITPSDMPSKLHEVAKQEPKEFLKKIIEATGPAAQEALERYKKMTPEERKRAVFHSTDSPEVGHFRVVITFERLTDARELIKSPNLLRTMMSGFPGGFGALPEHLVKQVVSETGVSVERLQAVWGEFAKHNGDLYRGEKPVEGNHLIGAESMIYSPLHALGEVDGVAAQALLALTTAFHRMDGAVPWVVSLVKGEEHVVRGVTIHVGEHPVKFWMNFGDKANVHVAPDLVKVAIARGIMVAEHRKQLVEATGQKSFESLLLDRRVAEEFTRLVGETDWRLNFDASVLAISDKLAGILAWLRLFHPLTAIPVDHEQLEKVKAIEDVKTLVDEGVKTDHELGGRVETEYVDIGSGEDGLSTDDAFEHLEDQSRELERRRHTNQEDIRRNEERQRETHDQQERRRLEEHARVLEHDRQTIAEIARRHEEERRRIEERRREEERRRR